MWLFHLHSTLKIQLFSPFFPLAGATDKACCRLSLWSFKKKASTIFYNTAKRKKSVFSPYYEDETVIFHGSAKEKRPFPRPSPPKTQIRLTYPSYLQRISSLSGHWLQPPLKRTVLKKLKKGTCGNATRPYSTSQRFKTHRHFLTCNHIGQKDMKSMLEFFRKTQHWSLIEDSKSRRVLEGIS